MGRCADPDRPAGEKVPKEQLSEMSLLGFYAMKHKFHPGSGGLAALPVLPPVYNGTCTPGPTPLFDGGSWGQYAGGIAEFGGPSAVSNILRDVPDCYQTLDRQKTKRVQIYVCMYL